MVERGMEERKKENVLAYEQIMGEGNKEKGHELHQEQLDFLVH